MAGVHYETDGPVVVLRLDDPDSMNALSDPIKDGLEAQTTRALADDAVRVIVITGTGKAFCAGGDIRSMDNRGALHTRGRIAGVHRWSEPLLRSDKLCITAVNGAAAGAGLGIALFGDLIYCADNALFKAGFPGVGAIPDLGIGYTLPRAVGHQRAMEILTLNRTIQPEEAERIGLVNGIFPADSLMAEVLRIAHKLASGPRGLGLTKMLLRRGYDETLERYHEVEAMAQAMAFSTEDFAEGVAAFLEKRKPAFKGR